MTEQDLVEIEARAERAKGGGVIFLLPWEQLLIRKDVPALVAEVRRLQALLRPSAAVS